MVSISDHTAYPYRNRLSNKSTDDFGKIYKEEKQHIFQEELKKQRLVTRKSNIISF